ncbi:MAG: AarF/ABC1/UbiB kinase family protein [Sphingobacteriia bacterium]|nr:AarF/ABC1/UbiB kinase family protein [Sphingobacteriia bacterium]NCC38630.1 AarF/ABC1/UbiB kinase family protein [Gammaproteobacteria bacterium]
MSSFSDRPGLAVPSTRLSRLWHLGRATGDLAAGIGVKGLIELARSRNHSESTRIRLSPEQTRRFTERLARMRGAVMKMGQLMSMDGSDIFTPEAAQIMSELRERAAPMPMSQLVAVLEREYGRGWEGVFKRFDFKPLAAASIGQVHRAETRDGRLLALKIQFPGVRASIDSDIDNLALLARTLGMIPAGLDLAPYLEGARRQLHQEADYGAEADALEAYRDRVGSDPDFIVPAVHRDLSTTHVLAMDFAEGVPIDRLADPPYTRAERDHAATALTRLAMRELFDFALVQSDPNFGNYLYDATHRRLVLLDFGAAVPVSDGLITAYRRLAQAVVADDRASIRAAAIELGYIGEADPRQQDAALIDLLRLAGEPLRGSGHYDFGQSDLFERVYRSGREMFYAGALGSVPAPETMFLHRKFMGAFMLCRRLRARVDLAGLLAPVL